MLFKNRLYLKIFLILIIFIKLNDFKKLKKYNGALIFYDPVTKYKILPPFVTSIKYRSFGSSKFPLIGRQCTCKRTACNCCAGINIPQYAFNHTFCARTSFLTGDYTLRMDVLMDDLSLMMYKITPRNPPPFCIPVPLPIPIPMGMCVKFYNIQLMGNKIYGCMDWILRVANTDVMVLHFACMTFGLDGIHVAGPVLSGHDDQEAADVYDPVELSRKCYI